MVIGDQPFFIQMKEGSELDFNLLSEFPISDRILKPRKLHSYLSPTCSYNFESEEEIRYYLKLASKFSANLNFDLIFKLVKTTFKQYVVLEDHYTTLLVADIRSATTAEILVLGTRHKNMKHCLFSSHVCCCCQTLDSI